MTKEDLRSVRSHLVGLRALFHEPAQGPTASDLVATVRHLCRSVFEGLDDNHCREQLDLIELYAADLFSERHETWRHGSQPGSDALKHKVRKCLTTIEARLLTLERSVAS